jgi:hypothetical protein
MAPDNRRWFFSRHFHATASFATSPRYVQAAISDGAARSDAAPAATGQDAAADAADTTVVELESGPLKKTVAVSKSKNKVIWSQG